MEDTIKLEDRPLAIREHNTQIRFLLL